MTIIYVAEVKKKKRSDPVLWHEPLYGKNKATTERRPKTFCYTQRMRTDCSDNIDPTGVVDSFTIKQFTYTSSTLDLGSIKLPISKYTRTVYLYIHTNIFFCFNYTVPIFFLLHVSIFKKNWIYWMITDDCSIAATRVWPILLILSWFKMEYMFEVACCICILFNHWIINPHTITDLCIFSPECGNYGLWIWRKEYTVPTLWSY